MPTSPTSSVPPVGRGRPRLAFLSRQSSCASSAEYATDGVGAPRSHAEDTRFDAPRSALPERQRYSWHSTPHDHDGRLGAIWTIIGTLWAAIALHYSNHTVIRSNSSTVELLREE
jgi:hypothetical protein